MKNRWIIFAIANYLLLAFSLFLFVGSLRFTVEVVPAEESLLSLTPLVLCFVFITIKCLFNLHVFYNYPPENKFSKNKRNFYLFSFVLFILSILTFIIHLISVYNDELRYDPESRFPYFILFIIFIFITPAIIIIVKQYSIISIFRKASNNF